MRAASREERHTDAGRRGTAPGRGGEGRTLAVAALAAAVLVGLSAPAGGQETGARGLQLEASALGTTLVGGAFPHDELGLGGTLGVHYRWPGGLSLGVLGLYAEPEDLDLSGSDPRRTMRMAGAGVELRYRLAPQASVAPFVGVRAGWTGLEDESDPGTFYGNGVGYGLVAGTEVWASDRVALRLSATGGGFSISNYFGGDGSTDALTWTAEAGLSVFLGSVSRDLDPDDDGVPEPRDRCLATPEGMPVDAYGCERDTDGDGVPDHRDACGNTPGPASVDRRGCPTDADDDRVYDGVDQCPDTPAGADVDARGCPTDGDGDGVPDGLDRCPDSTEGAEVDDDGCSTVAAGLDRGRLALDDVRFDFGSARLTEASRGLLDRVGETLLKRPRLVVQVQGHTDSIGSDEVNRELSWRRARSVVEYLTRQYPGLEEDRLVAVGMGETQPVADNATEAGRAENRRVEFVVVERRERGGDGQ